GERVEHRQKGYTAARLDASLACPGGEATGGAQAGCRIGPSTGTMNQKVLPSPKMDSTPMVPPWSSTNCLQSASPSPVPCSCRLDELSTWLKTLNILPMSSCRMPIPLSRTETH